MARLKWLLAAGFLGLLVLASFTARAEQDAPLAEPTNRFKGKFVIVYYLVDTNVLEKRAGSECLKDPVVEKIGDRFFITGAVHIIREEPDEPSWRAGAVASIAWDRVAQLYSFTPEQFQRAFAEATRDE